MKYIILLLIGLQIANSCLSQKARSFVFKIDSMAIDGRHVKASTIESKIHIGSPKYFKILDEDSLAIRIRIKLTSSGARRSKCKIRVDIYEKGKWYKPPFFIDIHNFTRFRIRRDQCWMRIISYSNMYPIEKNCQCRESLKGKNSHQFYLESKAEIN